ncbi:MAG: hypothetical protein PXZ08_08710 [Actinomycetota bacterium]|nr:hypothetical protein [Actinomycetota bacterium]
MDNLAILVPLKGFEIAKSRLREGGLDGVDEVVRNLALGVLRAAHPRPLFVACESPGVASFARECDAEVITSPTPGLNEAVTHAYRELSERFDQILIAHGDLRDPRGLGEYRPRDGVTVITDDRRTGTNALALPTKVDFNFRFGLGSAEAHRREAQRLGLAVHMDYESPWRFDVDEPADLIA